VIEAAHELPKEDRAFLADSFLDDLETQYQLVPRSQVPSRSDAGASQPAFAAPPFGRGPVFFPLWLPFLFLPVLFVTLAVLIHAPFFLAILIPFFLFRFLGWGRGRRGRWQYGPPRGTTSRYHL
jgi:hypothetical protein